MKTCSSILGGVFLNLVFAASATFSAAQSPAAATAPETQMQTQTASKPATSNESPKVFLLPAGTQLVAEFENNLNVKKLKPGDRVKAVLTQDLLLRGQIVAPVETKLIGHVVEASPAKDKDSDSHLAIVFDRAVLKKHQELAFNGIIAAMRPPAPHRSLVDKPDQMMPPPMMANNPVSTQPRGSGGGANRSASTSSSAPTTATMVAMGQLSANTTVQSNPGSNPGTVIGSAHVENPQKGSAASGGIGVAGVFGIPKVGLLPAGPNGTRPSVIVGKKSNLKLESGTQIILVVASSPLAKQ